MSDSCRFSLGWHHPIPSPISSLFHFPFCKRDSGKASLLVGQPGRASEEGLAGRGKKRELTGNRSSEHRPLLRTMLEARGQLCDAPRLSPDAQQRATAETAVVRGEEGMSERDEEKREGNGERSSSRAMPCQWRQPLLLLHVLLHKRQ